jgi:biopolymer transport protein ExbD
MLVSLSMVKLNDIKVNLPTGSASPDNSRNLLNITISRDGELFIDHTPVAENELARILADKRQHDPQLKVLISGDAQALHGRVVRAMDIVRQAGIDRVAIETTPTPASERP